MNESSAAGKDRYHRRDRLTDALSRRYFLELLEHEKSIADQTGTPFVLCLVDIDNFRGINETTGQKTGDRVLACLAEKLRNLLDSPPWTELVYLHSRFDGGSLMLFLPGCSVEKGAQLAESLRSRVAAAPLAGDVCATVSIGVAAYRMFESIDAAVARTERTLYLAKQFGRDRVEVAETPAPTRRVARVIPFTTVGSRRRPRAS